MKQTRRNYATAVFTLAKIRLIALDIIHPVKAFITK